MNRAESILIGLFVGIACPLLLFVFCSWTVAAITIYHVLLLPSRVIIIAGFTGLGIGLVMDIVWLKRWVRRFYTANTYLMIAVYLAMSVVALAFFMGLPIGSLVLGILAGAYVGRRQFHTGGSGSACSKAAHKVGLFAGLVTTAETLPIGLLALDEPSIINFVRSFLGLEESVIAGPLGVTLVAAMCVVLFVLQLSCTLIAATFTFSLGKEDGQASARADAQQVHR